MLKRLGRDDEQRAIVVDSVHHEVHEGEMFHAETLFASVNNAASADLLFEVGASAVHCVFEVNAGGQVNVYLYEGPTATAGTAVPTYNMKRSDVTHVAGMTVTHTPTNVTPGSVALVNGRLLAGGTSPQTRIGGGVRTGTEWMLKPNTKYLLRITNTSGSAIAINVAAEFYAGT